MTSPIHLQPEDISAAMGAVWMSATFVLVAVAVFLTGSSRQ